MKRKIDLIIIGLMLILSFVLFNKAHAQETPARQLAKSEAQVAQQFTFWDLVFTEHDSTEVRKRVSFRISDSAITIEGYTDTLSALWGIQDAVMSYYSFLAPRQTQAPADPQLAAQDNPKCKATTKAGKPCKGSPGKDNYCYFHSPSRVRCGAKKKSGGECQLIVGKAGEKCRYHK